MYDATAQMTHEFEGAILRSLFVGATSPYLVVKVRRSHLIHDTLLQMGMRKEDLKKPLKVQFVGEDGIDEGGVQKEFFQLIFGQILDVSCGMFVYGLGRGDDEGDASFYWFNHSSLENEREFELIGIILGAAIYNGVILEARFRTSSTRSSWASPSDTTTSAAPSRRWRAASSSCLGSAATWRRRSACACR